MPNTIPTSVLKELLPHVDHGQLLSLIYSLPLVVTVPEAAKLLKVGKNRMYEEVSSGRIRSVRIGNKKLIPLRVLLDWLDEEARAGTREPLVLAA